MPTEQQHILPAIRAETAFLRRRQLALLLVSAVAVFTAPLLLVSLFDLRWPLRETMAFAAVAAITAMAVVYGLSRLASLRSRLPNDSDVALGIENSRPELMDSLICAVEILDGRSQTPIDSPFSKSLLAKVDAELRQTDVHRIAAAQAMPGWRLLLTAVGLVVLLLLLAGLPLLEKAGAGARDVLTGEATGLTVGPGDIEVAEGDDLTIQVDIHRGPDQAVIRINGVRGEFSYDMYSEREGRRFFEFFGIDGAFTYVVETPTLRSRTYAVTTFQRPQVLSASIAVTPPAYTGLPPQQLNSLQDLAVPEGARVQMKLQTNLPVTAELLMPEHGPATFSAVAERQYQTTVTITKNDEYRLTLTDEKGRAVDSGRAYTIDCAEDFPPLLQPITPEEDAKVYPETTVTFSVKTNDEYGLTKVLLYYAINDRGWQTVELFTADAAATERTLEQTGVYGLELPTDVYDGDVIAYYFEARDNEPEPNVGVTDVRFVEVRPRPAEEDEGDGPSGSGPSISLSVADLIAEQKHLIRQTVNLHRLFDDSRIPEFQQALFDAARQLQEQTRQRFRDVEAQAGGQNLGVIGDLFDEALGYMDRVLDFMGRKLMDESLPEQQMALSRLVSIEIELQQASSKPSEDDQQQQQQQQQQQVSQQSKQEESEKAAEQLDQAIEKLNELIERQDNLNTRFDQQRQGIMNAAQRGFLAGRQRGIMGDTEELDEDLAKLRELTAPARKELARAEATMQQFSDRVPMAEDEEAAKSGEMSKRFLERGKELLEQAREKLGGDEMAQLNRELQALQQEQKQLRREAEQAAKSPPDKQQSQQMTQQQQQVRQQFEKLMQNLASAAEQAKQSNPEASKSLSECRNAGNSAGVGSNMKKSENALRYQRNDRAAEFQRQAESGLAKMDEHLQEAMNQRAPLSNEKLSEMLQQTMQNLAQAQAALEKPPPQEETQKLLEKFAEDLQQMADQMMDPEVQELSNQMDGWAIGGSGTPTEALTDASALLVATARLVESRLLQNAIRAKLDLARVAGRQPPDQYRKLVQEYFKKLSTQY